MQGSVYILASGRFSVHGTLVIHAATSAIIELHRRTGDAKLLRALEQYSVGQAEEALTTLCRTRGAGQSAAADRLSGVLEDAGTSIVTILDNEYPGYLRLLEKDAPPILYVLGPVSLLKSKTIAVIGTRNPSSAGRAAARTVAEYISRSGWTVVSGNAPGIDATAHNAAVKAGGYTLTFPPVPIDQYKQCFRGSFPDRITAASCFAPGLAVEPWMFLRRNSLVASHCRAGFVAETGTRGGTLDTVKKLRNLQKEIFATALPETANHCRAHAMLAAGGARLIDAADASSADLHQLLRSAENCLLRPAIPTPVLDDLFPEEFLLDG